MKSSFHLEIDVETDVETDVREIPQANPDDRVLSIRAVADHRTFASARIRESPDGEFLATVKNHPVNWRRDFTQTFFDRDSALRFAVRGLQDIVGPIHTTHRLPPSTSHHKDSGT